MKKIFPWVFLSALVVFLIAWGVMGVKLLDGNYDITAESYAGAGCIVVMVICWVVKLFSNRCPHCGNLRQTMGAYCSYCGKKID